MAETDLTIATADLPVAKPLSNEEAERQEAQWLQELEGLRELERTARQITLDPLHCTHQDRPQTYNEQDSPFTSPGSKNRHRRMLRLSSIVVVAVMALTAVITYSASSLEVNTLSLSPL